MASRRPAKRGRGKREGAGSGRGARGARGSRSNAVTLLAVGEDWLRLRGIRAYGHLGVSARERALGQGLEADVELAYPALARHRGDALHEAFDYEAVDRHVRDRLGKSRRRLLETAAEDLASSLLAAFPASRIRIRLRKLHVPVADFEVIPEVELERVRS